MRQKPSAPRLPGKAGSPLRAKLKDGPRIATGTAPELRWPGGRAGTK
jgi:hypothetical protein